MANHSKVRGVCGISGRSLPMSELVPAGAIRPAVADIIRREHPEWSGEGFISFSELNHYRVKYIEEALEADRGEISDLEAQVLESLRRQEIVTDDINVELDERRTLGERLSDGLTTYGGSWAFIISFSIFLFAWISLNSLEKTPFDPFPFILLNLLLSCLAAVQAPIIMMSQKRQEAKDRLRAVHDYRINLKAELEIRHLHEKLDHLLVHQWQRLLEIQHQQTEIMEELAKSRRRT